VIISRAGGEAELEYLENCNGSVTRPLELNISSRAMNPL